MAPIFSFVVLVQHPKRGHDSGGLPFLCLPCSGRPYTFLVAKNVVYRATKQLKYSHGTQRATSTWFRLTNDRGHVTPNKFPGPHSDRLDVCQLGLGIPISMLSPYQLQGDIYHCFSCTPLGTYLVRSSSSRQDRQSGGCGHSKQRLNLLPGDHGLDSFSVLA